MFDLTTGTIDRPFRDSHPAASVVAVTSHVAVIGAVVGVILFGISSELPKVPSMIAFVAEMPATPPPPPPPAPPSAPQAANKPQPTPPDASGPTFVAPAETPVGIQPESSLDFGESGVAGGVPGGVPGGIEGGVLGGLASDVPPPPPPPPAPRVPKRVGGDIKAPALIHRVEPYYPPVAVSAKITGIVILEATVNETGDVVNVTVLRSIPFLDKPSIEAVKQWRYEPLLLNGAPFPFVITVTLTFSVK